MREEVNGKLILPNNESGRNIKFKLQGRRATVRCSPAHTRPAEFVPPQEPMCYADSPASTPHASRFFVYSTRDLSGARPTAGAWQRPAAAKARIIKYRHHR